MKINQNKTIEELGIKYIWVELPKEAEKCYIVPIADCHIGAKGFNEKKFRGYLEWIRDTPEALCFFNGDLCNCGLPFTVDTDFWDQEPLTPQEQIDKLVKIIKSYNIKDKIIGIVGGSNHHARAKKITGHDYDLEFAEKLGLRDLYSYDGLLWKISLGHWRQTPDSGKEKPSNRQQVVYTMFATHGWSGGRMAGSSINAIRELGSVWLCDVYVVSHRHLDSVTPDLFIVPNMHTPSVQLIRRVYVTSGSFLNYTGYALRKGLRPTPPNTPRIRLDGKKKDVHVSV